MWKKVREPPHVRKKLSHVTKIYRIDAMLVVLNITMQPSNLRKKIKKPLYVTKELSNMILELHYVIIEPSNVRKK